MYAAIRRYTDVKGDAAELARRVEEGFLPLIRQVRGFMNYYLLDAGPGTLATISVFETREGAEESNRVAADWVKKNIAQFLPKPPEITAGELRVHGGARATAGR